MGGKDESQTRRIAAVGTFDGVHLGHQAVIRQVCGLGREHGLTPTIFSFTDHPLQVIAPGRAPLMLTTPESRVSLLRQYGAAEVILLRFDDDMRQMSARDFITMLHDVHGVDMLVMGFNNRFGHNAPHDYDEYRRMGQELGVTIVRADELTDTAHGLSINSSTVRRLVGAGDIATANSLLGHPYTLCGTVVHGRAVGRSIDFPTANIEPATARLLIPAEGVYAAYAGVCGMMLPAMVNIGTNPTLNYADSRMTVEAHVLDYEGDLYGQDVCLSFIGRIRGEHKFNSLAMLHDQLIRDRDMTRQILQDTTLISK